MSDVPDDPRHLQRVIDVLHEQGIGCNYRNVPYRRWHSEPVPGDDDGYLVTTVWDDPEPTGYDHDGWKHEGDHEAVARAILGLRGAADKLEGAMG